MNLMLLIQEQTRTIIQLDSTLFNVCKTEISSKSPNALPQCIYAEKKVVEAT